MILDSIHHISLLFVDGSCFLSAAVGGDIITQTAILQICVFVKLTVIDVHYGAAELLDGGQIFNIHA